MVRGKFVTSALTLCPNSYPNRSDMSKLHRRTRSPIDDQRTDLLGVEYGMSPCSALDRSKCGVFEIARSSGAVLATTSPATPHNDINETDITMLPNFDVKLAVWTGSHLIPRWAIEAGGSNHIALSGDGTRIAVRQNQPNFVRIYSRTGGRELNELGSPIIGPSPGASVAVSEDGSHLAVSSELHSSFSGRVDVFRFADDGEWLPHGCIHGREGGRYFGWATRFSSKGDRLVISSLDGTVSVYENGPWWERLGSTLTTNEANSFGYSVDISSDGSTLVVGAPLANGNGKERGAVFVYVAQHGGWALRGPPLYGLSDMEHLGRSVRSANMGSRILVSGDKGKFHIHDWKNGQWQANGLSLDGWQHAAITHDGGKVFAGKNATFSVFSINVKTQKPQNEGREDLREPPIVTNQKASVPIDPPSIDVDDGSSIEKFSVLASACPCDDNRACLDKGDIRLFDNLVQFCVTTNRPATYRVGALKSLSTSNGPDEKTYLSEYRRALDSPDMGQNHAPLFAGPLLVRAELGVNDSWGFFQRSWRAIGHPKIQISGKVSLFRSPQEMYIEASYNFEMRVHSFRLLPFLAKNDGAGWTIRIVSVFLFLLLGAMAFPIFRYAKLRIGRYIRHTRKQRDSLDLQERLPVLAARHRNP